MKKVYIITGYGATAQDHWFVAVRDALHARGVHAEIAAMPNPNEPDIKAWLAYMGTFLADIDDDTIIIAHSLGCITTMRYLSAQSNDVHLKGLILVSPFAEKLPSLPVLDSFTNEPIDLKRIRGIADECEVIVSTNDAIVPSSLSYRFAEAIQGTIHAVEDAGHFLAEDGYTTFDLVSQLTIEAFGRSQ